MPITYLLETGFFPGPFFTPRVLSVTIPQGPCKNPSYPNSLTQQLPSPVYSTPTDLGLISLIHCCSKSGHSYHSLPPIWSLLIYTSFSDSRKPSKRPPYHDTPSFKHLWDFSKVTGQSSTISATQSPPCSVLTHIAILILCPFPLANPGHASRWALTYMYICILLSGAFYIVLS